MHLLTMPRTLLALALALAALTLALAPVALAQDRDVSDREAQARFESGRLAFEAGRYEEALTDFQRAYELSHRALILYNVGITLDRLRRDAEAAEAFERYLAESPEAPNRTEVEARIVRLRRPSTEPTDAPPPEPEPEPEPAPVPAPATFREGYAIWAGISGALALAAGGAAIGTWVATNDQYAALDARCGALGCPRSEIDASGAPGLVVGTNALLVTSLVAAASTIAALTLLFVDVPTEGAVALRIGPGSLRLTF